MIGMLGAGSGGLVLGLWFIEKKYKAAGRAFQSKS
jgi:hypothetical protein